jgi:ABC-type glycerol-3-phosphate transport system substrate-binding protein
MASRKIIFFAVIGLLIIWVLLALVKISKSTDEKQAKAVQSLSIWAVWGASEDYKKIFEWARETVPEIKDATFDIRVFPSYESYRDVLLSTLASDGGPDIFMIEAGADDILASKSVSIPGRFLDLTNYEKRYEDIFLDLLETDGEWKELTQSLKWVPLWYETLGIFYHKSLFPVIPKTWNEIDALYRSEGSISFFPVNIGMWPSYTPSATDIIALFFARDGIGETKNIRNAGSALASYISYANTELSSPLVDTDTSVITPMSLASEKENFDSSGLSTLDLFIKGRIGMAIGFPSLIRDIEKAQKRAEGDILDDLILTERIPVKSLSETKTNLARYSYFVVSQNTKNPIPSARLLAYLMTPPALEKIREVFPYLISPDRTIMATQGNTSLSTVFWRTRLDAFLPTWGEQLFVYRYWLKGEYEKIFRDYIDRSIKTDISTILTRIQKNVECKIESSSGMTLSSKCLEE